MTYPDCLSNNFSICFQDIVSEVHEHGEKSVERKKYLPWTRYAGLPARHCPVLAKWNYGKLLCNPTFNLGVPTYYGKIMRSEKDFGKIM